MLDEWKLFWKILFENTHDFTHSSLFSRISNAQTAFTIFLKDIPPLRKCFCSNLIVITHNDCKNKTDITSKIYIKKKQTTFLGPSSAWLAGNSVYWNVPIENRHPEDSNNSHYQPASSKRKKSTALRLVPVGSHLNLLPSRQVFFLFLLHK